MYIYFVRMHLINVQIHAADVRSNQRVQMHKPLRFARLRLRPHCDDQLIVDGGPLEFMAVSSVQY